MPNVAAIPIEQVLEPYPLKKRTPLSVAYPEVAVQWFWENNCGFGPEDFSSGTLGCPFCRG